MLSFHYLFAEENNEPDASQFHWNKEIHIYSCLWLVHLFFFVFEEKITHKNTYTRCSVHGLHSSTPIRAQSIEWPKDGFDDGMH